MHFNFAVTESRNHGRTWKIQDSPTFLKAVLSRISSREGDKMKHFFSGINKLKRIAVKLVGE